MHSRFLVAVLVALLALPAAAAGVDPSVSPRYTKRHAMVKSSYAQLTPEVVAKSLPPVGLLGKEQFRQLSATWAQFHRSVATGNIDVLRTVVRNARACRDALAVKAELLMESRAQISSPDGAAERSMGDWILSIGPVIQPEQLGQTSTPFLVSDERALRVRFGNVTFVESEGGFWSVDLGC